MKVWSSGQILDSAISISSLNYSLHYGSPCIWEGIRAYTQENGLTKIFKLQEHIDRLYDSAKIMGFEIPNHKEELVQACKEVVKALGTVDAYLRPIAYADGDAESAKPKEQTIRVDIYAFPLPPLHDRKSIATIISSFKRGYPQYQMQAKTPSNYHFLNTVKHEIELSKVDDAFLTDNDGYITEATVANVFVVKKNQVFTPPSDGSILEGITRGVIKDILFKEMGISVTEKKITRADMYTADEIFICGTYAEVVNVEKIDGRSIPGGNIFKTVKEIYKLRVRGSK